MSSSQARRLETATLTNPLDLVANVDRRWLAGWAGLLLVVTAINLAIPELAFEARLLSYIGIVSCFTFVITSPRRDFLLMAALGATLIADLFLIMLGYIVPGVAVFCVVQLIHAYRLRFLVHTSPLPFIGALIVMVAVGVLMQFSLVYMLGSVYACVLAHNFLAAKRFYDTTNYLIVSARIFWGFVLFVACDFCVAITFFISSGLIVDPIIPVTVFGAMTYFFYLPSQILLALSGTRQPGTSRVE